MTARAIVVDRLSKLYRLGKRDRYPTLRDVLADAVSSPFSRASRLLGGNGAAAEPPGDPEELWALRDVSLTVTPGEVLGVIGRNGAGKSTFLKILSRITDPTTGSIEIHGRVGSLLEVGTGFHPELTGRENIYLNGAILGMHRTEIARKFDEIVAFAETERFVDTAVKHYSSGMYMRLAFAVAAHLEAEILVVDEVLAVGDVAFQRKCMGKIGDVAHAGKTVLFVSHNLEAIQRLCTRCVLLERGQLVDEGTSTAVVARYLSGISAKARPNEWIELADVGRLGTGASRFRAIQYTSERQALGFQPYTGGPLEITLAIVSDAPRSVGSLAVTIYNQLGTKLVNADTRTLGQALELRAGETHVRLRIDRLYLNPGVYRLGLWLADPISGRFSGGAYDFIESAFEIEVFSLESEGIGFTSEAAVACEFTVAALAPVP